MGGGICVRTRVADGAHAVAVVTANAFLISLVIRGHSRLMVGGNVALVALVAMLWLCALLRSRRLRAQLSI